MPVINPKAGQPTTARRHRAMRRAAAARHPAQKLNELPDADVYAAVYRKIGKCEAPIIVKYGVSGG